MFATESRAASSERTEASRQSAIADRQITSGVLLFTTWVEADVQGQQEIAAEIADRFQDHFTPAFEAWIELPVTQGHLPDGSPFDLDEYVVPSQQAFDAANARAEEAISRANEAAGLSSRFVLSTVLFASVLFLAGIASKLSDPDLPTGWSSLPGSPSSVP